MVDEAEIFGDDWKGLQEGVGATPVNPTARTQTAPKPGRGRFAGCILTVLTGIGALVVLLIVAQMVMGVVLVARGKDFFGFKSGVQKEVVREGDPQSVIAVVSLNGLIEPSDFRGGAAAQFLEALSALKDEPNLKAVIVEIESPGGSATTSDIIHHRLGEIKAPKVALLGNIAASGGYYVAVACDKIVAHPTGITGSIGVILEVPQVFGLMDKLGLGWLTVKSAEHKDLASPFRAPSDIEIAVLQRVIDAIFDRFVSLVAQGRNMKPEEVKQIADGRIFAAPDALKERLIDAIGYREDAIAEAERLAGVANATVVEYAPSPGVLELLGLVRRGNTLELDRFLQVQGPMFLYKGPVR